MLPIPKAVLNIPGRESIATQELVFKADMIPPLGFKSYYVQRVGENNITISSPEENKLTIENEVTKCTLLYYFVVELY